MNQLKRTVIFLDVDGVLTSMRCNGWYDFDLWAVSFLRWACAKSGAMIVMSSAWRTIPEAKEWFTQVFDKHLHADWRTKEDFRTLATRSDEINEWLSRHPEVGDFVVIDDTAHGLEKHRPQLVLTDEEDGMLLRHMRAIKEKLRIHGELPRLEPIFNDPVCFYRLREKRQIGHSAWIKELQERNARKLAEEAADEEVSIEKLEF
jgi:hypothetical protein